jgi:hypothetical protein
MNLAPDRVVSAIVLIVVGLLQITGAYYFPLWLVVICLGIMLMLER